MVFPVPRTRFLESSRGQIVTLLRRGQRTVEELAQALGLSDNAIRNHLSALERDGVVLQAGVRRTSGAGKPAVLYELHADAALLLSRAYPPVLGAVIDVLLERMNPGEADALLREVGRRLAAGGGPAAGDVHDRMQRAADVLTAMGGDVALHGEPDGSVRLQGSGCPLSAVVSTRPEFCRAVESLVAEVSGVSVRSRCEHGARPRCCFVTDGDQP